MRTLLVSFVIWVLLVPVFVALFLIFTFIAAFVQDLYCAAISFALAFAILTMVWGPFWFAPFSGSSGPWFSKKPTTPKFKPGEKA